MAEAVVSFVVDKLGEAIVKEAQFLGGVRNKVERLKRELTRIQCCLRDAASKRKGDARVQNWLHELREVAYSIEDTIDTFFLQVEGRRRKHHSFLQKVKKLCHKPHELYFLHKLGTNLDNIYSELEEISKSRVAFGIRDLQDIVGEAVEMPLRRATYHEVDETEVIGIQADKNNILKLLRPEETLRRAIITIVGTGGIGKSTLAHIVYKSAKEEFMYHIMLSISKQFDLTDLLRKMLHQLEYVAHENQDVGDLTSKLKSCLNNKRYLIILDDVWDVNLWDQLKHALPDVMNGSRVLMTSRFENVAKFADSEMEPYKLKLLDSKNSLDLLLKKALPYQEHHKELPGDLFQIANELAKQCNGLPLALIVIGGILSTKERNYSAWNKVFQTMDWQMEGKSCMDVLAMSYEDMPYNLKACFLYLAAYPEDYEISVKCLIKMWVAEGLIPRDGRITMEEMADAYLEELFQRSMIQVTRRSVNGSIKCFRVHDLIRDLAKSEARQENFVMVFSQASDVNQCNRGIRRASLHNYDPQFMEYLVANTRSLLFFGYRPHLPNCSNFRLLKVLEIVGVKDCTLDPAKELEKLIHLKYLGFRNWNIRINFSSRFFERKMNLETLDIRGTPTVVSNNLWAISTLRHVLVNDVLTGPNSTADLKNLQTMQWVSPLRTWEMELPILNNLRKLGVRKFYNDNIPWVVVTNLLETLPFLLSLCIADRRGDVPFPKEIVYPCALPNYQNLQSLYLDGVWSENVTLEARLFPANLVKLILINSRFRQNPMPELGKLKSLKKLCFREHDLCYWGPAICSGGFPVLQCLKVGDNIFGTLTVAKGVMPKLIDLQASDSMNLELPPELQHVLHVRHNRW